MLDIHPEYDSFIKLKKVVDYIAQLEVVDSEKLEIVKEALDLGNVSLKIHQVPRPELDKIKEQMLNTYRTPPPRLVPANAPPPRIVPWGS
jgi:hypothetical protein